MNTLIPKTNPVSLSDSETSEELISLFISNIDVSQSSKKTYFSILEQFFAFLRENEISHPIRSDILHYKEEMLKSYGAKTINLHMSVLRNFFSFTDCARIYPNVALNVKGVRSNKVPKHQALSSKQIEDILNSIDCSTLTGRQQYAIVLICATTGLRVAEVSNLNVGDLCVIQDQSVLMVKGKGYADKIPVIIGPSTDKAIRYALSFRESFSPKDPLFISTSNYDFGNRISPKGIGKLLKKILVSNGFKGRMYTAHSFRHSACILGMEVSEKDLLATKQFMRHSNIETTLIYADHQELLGTKALAREIEKKFNLDNEYVL